MLIAVKHPKRQLQFENREQVTLRTLQEMVGGYIEVTSAQEMREQNILMIVNEEGKLAGLPFNFPCQGEKIVGSAVFMSRAGEEFGTLDEAQVAWLSKRFKTIDLSWAERRRDRV